MADVCGALGFSHLHGVVHRDVKPANIMITPSDVVKVMDFGIARAMAETGPGLTGADVVIGTAQYLAPEQGLGQDVDARADVYAAGCVLFELLTGEPPFTGDSPVAIVYQHVREDPPLPSDLAPGHLLRRRRGRPARDGQEPGEPLHHGHRDARGPGTGPRRGAAARARGPLRRRGDRAPRPRRRAADRTPGRAARHRREPARPRCHPQPAHRRARGDPVRSPWCDAADHGRGGPRPGRPARRRGVVVARLRAG